MNPHDQFEYGEKRGFGARYGFVIGIVVVAVIGVVLFNKMFSGQKSAPPRKAQEMVMIRPTPPAPPPPPPPPPPQTPQEAPKEQMLEQTPVDEAEAKPEPQEAPSPAMGTNVQGNGAPDGFGLSGNKAGFLGGGSGGGKTNGSRFGWYANLVVKSVTEALSQNSRTRNASFNIKVRIWSDVGGRVTRAKLAETSGDPAIDEAIRSEILNGFQLKEPPPEGMPMPIVMRLTARRPN
jgi:periplasmic protein TonB